MESLSGKTALITGASKRLGRSIALALAGQGCDIILHYNRSQAEAETLAAEIKALGVSATPVQADLCEGGVPLWENIQASGLFPEILVNNASVFPADKLQAADFSSMNDNLMVNAYAPFELSREFYRSVEQGSIVNLLDCRIADYDKEHFSYHVSKKVFHDLTRMMAVEFAPRVRVNAVAPGLVLPPEGEGEEYLERLKHTNLLASYGEANDIAEAVLFLCRSDFITGQVLYVDGGRHIRGKMYG